jgi:hypothetical protein
MEMRRAAATACALQKNKGHVPALIEALQDEDPALSAAAHQSLKKVTGRAPIRGKSSYPPAADSLCPAQFPQLPHVSQGPAFIRWTGARRKLDNCRKGHSLGRACYPGSWSLPRTT